MSSLPQRRQSMRFARPGNRASTAACSFFRPGIEPGRGLGIGDDANAEGAAAVRVGDEPAREIEAGRSHQHVGRGLAGREVEAAQLALACRAGLGGDEELAVGVDVARHERQLQRGEVADLLPRRFARATPVVLRTALVRRDGQARLALAVEQPVSCTRSALPIGKERMRCVLASRHHRHDLNCIACAVELPPADHHVVAARRRHAKQLRAAASAVRVRRAEATMEVIAQVDRACRQSLPSCITPNRPL